MARLLYALMEVTVVIDVVVLFTTLHKITVDWKMLIGFQGCFLMVLCPSLIFVLEISYFDHYFHFLHRCTLLLWYKSSLVRWGFLVSMKAAWLSSNAKRYLAGKRFRFSYWRLSQSLFFSAVSRKVHLWLIPEGPGWYSAVRSLVYTNRWLPAWAFSDRELA